MGRSLLQTATATEQASDIQAAQAYLVASGQNPEEAQASLQLLDRTAVNRPILVPYTF